MHQGIEGIETIESGVGIRSRAQALLMLAICVLCGAGAYRCGHDILRVRGDGGASIVLAADKDLDDAARRDGVVLATNEIAQRIAALRRIASSGDGVAQQARDALVHIERLLH